ncbi:DUF3850 domain-containing protein [Enterococcus sp. AZ103]|uniref:DUF3850 domain-containing protein n=1 Tax=Enterococcus sp. AZ103 TaxID=2774628 RepID=UPI003F1F76D1
MKTSRHILKILPEYYEPVVNHIKTFEIRKNDRDFKTGDWIKLLEFDGKNYTGNYVNALITYITSYEQKTDYVVFSIQTLSFGVHNSDSIKQLTQPRKEM